MDNETIKKAVKVATYFTNQYGEGRAKLICEKLAISVDRFSYEDLINIGEKIALFNGYTTLENLQKKGY